MKNLISTLIITTLAIVSMTANGFPVNSAEVKVESSEIFQSASYDQSEENLVFTTNDAISLIQIYDAEGTLEFQLPVMSNQVTINKNLFEEGTYELGFLIEGDSKVHFSKVTIK